MSPDPQPTPSSRTSAWINDPGLAPWRPVLSTAPAARTRAVDPATEPQAPALETSATKPSQPSSPASIQPTGHPGPSTATPGARSPSPESTTKADQLAARPGTAFAVNDLLTGRRARPTSGWRGAVYSLTDGLWNPGLSTAEAQRRRLIDRVRTQLLGSHQVVVTSLKGGIGKTTLTAGIGLTLAEHRGDRIVALDANPDAGTLADRLTGHVGVTVRDLINNLDTIKSWTDIAHYTSLAGRLQVLASDQDPAMSEAFNRDEYKAIIALLVDFNNVVITDSGTGLVHSAMSGALDSANTLVIAGAPTLDGASRASKTLDWLLAHGYSHLVESAVVALSHDRTSRWVDTHAIRKHFAERCHAVIDIPPDPHLATGGLISLDEMRPHTRTAFLQLAAHVAEQFSWQPTARQERASRQELT